MIKAVLIGYGNVNSHLLKALANSNKTAVVQLYTRSEIQLPTAFQSIPHTQDLNELKEADVYIVAISDDAILDFSENLPLNNQLVVHTSGDRKSTRLNSSHVRISYAVFCLKKKKNK